MPENAKGEEWASLVYDYVEERQKEQHGLVEGGVDRRSVSILKWSHCVTLGKSSAPVKSTFIQ